MREHLLDAMAHRDDLAAVDRDFVHMFSSWFNRGFLVLRRIDWSTPASILERIIRYEAVHRIRGWDDLRRRIDPPDRRCYAFFHPALVDDPLIFVEVALTREIPDAIEPILAVQRDPVELGRADDRGVLFDLELPARARRRHLRQFPDQAGGRGDRARVSQALDLRDAVAGARLRRLAAQRARVGIDARAHAGGPRGAVEARYARTGGRSRRAAIASRSRCCAPPPGISCTRKSRAARRSIRSRASISATARDLSASTGSPTPPSAASRSRTA